jgi:purine-nucleoside phosphorylase
MDTAPVAFAVSRLRSFAPEVALVLGSGLDGVAATISASGSLPYGAITNGCTTTVPGHPGTMVWGTLADRRVLMFRGRFHRYEGHDRTTVCWPVMLSASLGVRLLVLTNAAGGIRTDLLPGTLMLVRGWIDWINWTGREQHKRLPVEDTVPDWAVIHPLPIGKEVTLLAKVAGQQGLDLREGVLATVSGPNYETPAEIRALRALGADAVGMSTAAELACACQLSLPVVAISCITNRAAGLAPVRLCHSEVLQQALQMVTALSGLLAEFLRHC